MSNTLTRLRIITQEETQWDIEGRELTIRLFIDEVSQVVSPDVLEYLADSDTEKLRALFCDWAKYRKERTSEQRISLMVASVAKYASPMPFAYAHIEGNEDLNAPVQNESNVVSLRSMR
jgi:hypothetical protein